MSKKKQVTPRLKGRNKSPHFIRQWRKHRGLTLERLAERLEMTAGNLSEIEVGNTNYTQPTLEALALALNCTPADLLMRDPSDPEGIWSVWDNALPGQRAMIVDLARTVLKKTGT